MADTDERARKAFLKQGAPHDGKLRDLDIAFDRAAIEAGGEEEHIAQEGVAESFIQQRAGRTTPRLQGRLIQAR